MPEKQLITFEAFRDRLRSLVEECDTVLHAGPGAVKGKPEPFTEARFIVPFLEALNFDKEHYLPQAEIPKAEEKTLSWVDYRLLNDRGGGIAFLEAKSMFDGKDLWTEFGGQVLDYMKNYRLSLKYEQPIKWIILTNFVETHILYSYDRKPFLVLNYKDYVQKADLLWRLFERSHLQRDVILSHYYESQSLELGKMFLKDLKLWRLIIANGYKQMAPGLTLDHARLLSEQMLSRIILVRVLESCGLQMNYSLVKLFNHWSEFTRNKDKFPFHFDVNKMFADIEQDYDTDLLKPDLARKIARELSPEKPLPILVKNEFLSSVILPDDTPEKIVYQTLPDQLGMAYRSVYNYDFNTLTDDVVGAVYEQYLAHRLTEAKGRIIIDIDQSKRQEEGAYYTAVPIVKYLVDRTVGATLDKLVDSAIDNLGKGEYKDAACEMDKIKSVKVVDLACGSGAFLIYAFDVISAAYEKYNACVRRIRTENTAGYFALVQRGLLSIDNVSDLIIQHNIYGIDKDPQAVGVAKLNLYIKLLRSETQGFSRRGADNTVQKLPLLEKNIIARDSILPLFDVRQLTGDGQIIIIGNPPWGAELEYPPEELVEAYSLAKGQFDSYEIFLERAAGAMRDGDMLGYVIPDSILQLPEHEQCRKLLLEACKLMNIIKLGEGFFEDVFRAAVNIVLEKGKFPADHTTACAVLVKEDRKSLQEAGSTGSIRDLEVKKGHPIHQSRFVDNKGHVLDIYTEESDEEIIALMDKNPIRWRDLLNTGRGAELTKSGEIIRCPYCGIWNNIPRKRKDGSYHEKQCSNPKCDKKFDYAHGQKATIISKLKVDDRFLPIIIGEDINRYRILNYRYIDVTRQKLVPRCPHCNEFDTLMDVDSGPWVCVNADCGKPFSKDEVKDVVRLGINYKKPELYAPDKLVVRKTGRGIYATIDRTNALTTQVTFIYKIKPDAGLDGNYLYYLLGVLNSRLMLYKYYKKTGDIEWKSFPYLTQKEIEKLPIYNIDLKNPAELDIYNRITTAVREVIVRGTPPTEAEDELIEQLVRRLYKLTPEMSARVDSALKQIEQSGTLLGNRDAQPDEEESLFDAEEGA